MSLALVVGAVVVLSGLMASDVGVHAQQTNCPASPCNTSPRFDNDTSARSVPENTPPGVNIEAPISATDADEDILEYGDTLTYSLGGTDAASFDIDASTGQLITKAPLDRESKDIYQVVVTVKDSGGDGGVPSEATARVTITVTNVDESPLAPAPPTVVSGQDNTGTDNEDESTTTLKVVWHPPDNAGRLDISTYTVQFKKSAGTFFGVTGVGSISGTTVDITGLEVDTSYDVRVRATNRDGEGPWSLVGTGSTNKEGNSSPSFPQTSPPMLHVPENSSAGQNVGAPVTADDADARTLSYRFEGRDADLFDFNSSSGQIRTKRGVTYNHEDPACGYVHTVDPTACIYFVTVVAFDRAGGSDAIRVNIQVDDRNERPSAPARPTVRPTANSTTSLDVSWGEPANTGPAITAYNVEYRRKGSSSNFSSSGVPDTVIGTSTTISGIGDHDDDSATDEEPWLTPGISYEVRVRAATDEGTSPWSTVGTGSTNVGNREPVFRDRNIDDTPVGTHASTSREVNENTPSGRAVSRPVVADDGDGDRRTYKLVAAVPDDAVSVAAAAKFGINESTGQILTKEPLNHEDAVCGYIADADPTVCTYMVKVEVRDGLNTDRVKEESEAAADDTITVEITVKDLDEPPTAPEVTVTSPTDVTTLRVTWSAANTGPDIIDYDLRYRKGSDYLDDNCLGVEAADNCENIAVGTTTTTIIALSANTSYRVEVRASNAEGTSPWSSVTEKTNRNKSDGSANEVPDFGTVAPLSVPEGDQSGRVVGTVDTSDSDGGTVRYSLVGPNKNLFSINASSGEIRTRAALNHEENSSYMVRVKLVDGQGGSATVLVTINVGDEIELPSKPSALKVTPTKNSGLSLDVTWSEPLNTGPTIDDYDIQYREVGGSDDTWIDWPHGTATDPSADSTERTTTIKDLKPRTTYEVEVRAENDEGDGPWTSAVRGTTNVSNNRPDFDSASSLVILSVDENTRTGQPVGSPVSASDDDRNRLIYSLEGPGAASFTIVSSSGQIRTRAALNHEERTSYSVTVKVNDGQKRNNSVAAKSVTINIGDVDEQPSVPGVPRVSGVPGSTDSVRVTWDAPANTGPSITDYDLQYGVAGTGGFADWHHEGIDRGTTITGLAAGTRYEVRVRARSAEGTSDYSRSGTGSPNPDIANRNPAFSRGAHTFNVAENMEAGDPIGSPVAASDPDDDPPTYELEGTDAALFDIDSASGQIRTSAALNHEEKARHSVTVRARDGRGGTATARVTINVTDVAEPPSAPLSPEVIGASSTSLQVSWAEPENTGPPITDYDYRYRGPTVSSWTEVTNTTITARTVTISGLTSSTSYEVQVRARNAEGAGDWSSPGIGSTNAPGANNPPVFSEGASAVRSVSASAQPGTSVGASITATDADQGDTLNYSLEGRDTAFFDINTINGQLLTRSGVTLLAGETYTVTVVADDSKDRAFITVTIEATAAPPNNPPVFSEGASATRSVVINARVGTNIGQPFRATDADTGDTVTFSLEGPDAASFDMNGSTGQLRTKAGVTLESKTYNVTVVAADQKGANTIIVVTIEIEDRDGRITLSPAQPQFGDTVTARLSDPDGGVTGVTWQWAVSSNGTTNWIPIIGANSATYRPAAAYVGNYLRATASYTDDVGPGKSAQGITAAVGEDDDGTVTFSTRSPEVGSAITATLSDPDGGVTGATWQWEKSSNGSTGWTDIQGATSASYTPGESDAGIFLRATASYDDAVGTGKSAQAATSSGVAQMELLSEYDANRNESIERSEAIRAVSDYFDGEISKDDVLAVLVLYFSG